MTDVNKKFCTSVGYHLFETLSEAQKFCKEYDIPEEAIVYDDSKEHLDKMFEVSMIEASYADEIESAILCEINSIDNKIKRLECEKEDDEKNNRGILSNSYQRSIYYFQGEVGGLIKALIIMTNKTIRTLKPISENKQYPFEENISNKNIERFCSEEHLY